MRASKLALLIAFLTSITLSAQSSIRVIPQVIADQGTDSGTCPPQGERDAVQQSLRSALFNILRQNGTRNVDSCGPGQWYRIAYLNMRDSSQECPTNWMEIDSPVRVCGRPRTNGASCVSAFFPSPGPIQYSKVCGRTIGYQNGSTDSFALREVRNIQPTIDNPYVDGVSVTHGMPRAHIWTFSAGGSDATILDYVSNCPCANPAASVTAAPAPSFVGDNYFCESGNSGGSSAGGVVFTGDPLWDGEQSEGVCCSNNGRSPPWFGVTLPNPTSDDIEVRICGDEGTHNEDSPIQLLEIYIQ